LLVKALTAIGRDTILEYLASGQTSSYFLGLPIFTTRNEANTTLFHPLKETRRVLLSAEDEIFSQIDEHAILLRVLPPSVAQLLLMDGASFLNVTRLSAKIVIKYLADLPEDTNRFTWLLAFWLWLPKYTSKSRVLANSSLLNLQVVPAWDSGYLSLGKTIFVHPGDSELVEALSSSGYQLIHEELSGETATMLQQEGGVCSTANIQHLLRHARSTCIVLSSVHGPALYDHVISLFLKLRNKKPLGTGSAKRLRLLPIYEIASTNAEQAVREWRSLPETSTAINIQSSVDLVPTIPATVFVRDLSTAITTHLSGLKDKGRLHNQAEIIRIGIQNLPDQDKAFQADLLQYIAQHHASLPQDIVKSLQYTSFVQSSTNGLRTPLDLLDPECEIAVDLYEKTHERLPAQSNEVLRQIVTNLQNLGLFCDTFTNDIIHECIMSIQDQSKEVSVRLQKACRLIELIGSQQYQCSGLEVKPTWTNWLPTTDDRLTSADKCLDPSLYNAFLFDRVVPALKLSMSPPLRTAVGLNKPPSNAIIIRQLDATLFMAGHSVFERLCVIYKELGKRHFQNKLSLEELRQLEDVVKDRAWLPIAPNIVLDNKKAAFSVPFTATHGLPFCAIPTIFAALPGVSQLLSRLGCADMYVAACLAIHSCL
jgi:hypothetical protein